jgi:hypothetical protein
MIDLMPKLGAFGVALLGGAGTLATSIPAVEEAAGNAMPSITGWGGIILGGCSLGIAVVGMIMAFMDKRKIQDAETSNIIIESQKSAIKYLKDDCASLRERNSILQTEFEEARKRGHRIAEDSHHKLMKAEMKIATYRAWMAGNGYEALQFPGIDDPEPIFPKSATQPIKLHEEHAQS